MKKYILIVLIWNYIIGIVVICLSWKYLGFGQNEAALAEAAAEWGIDPKSEMYKLPSLNVGTYAERDAEATFGLWQEMTKEIIAQDLQSIMELETDLFPCLVDMRFKGVRVDVERAHNLKKTLINEENDIKTLKKAMDKRREATYKGLGKTKGRIDDSKNKIKKMSLIIQYVKKYNITEMC